MTELPNSGPDASQQPERRVDDVELRQHHTHEEFELQYGAEHVMKLFIPVSVCMLAVVVTISNINFYSQKGIYFIYTPFHETSNDSTTKIWNAVANTVIFLSVIIFMTTFLIMLYKYRFYKVINAWLIVSTTMLMFFFAYLFFEEVLRAYNIPMDIFTILLFDWNFGVVGMIAVHWKGPLKLQQAYLIFIAVLMSLFFIKHLPEWTTWVLLFGISIWDLMAVLTPKGPLRMLVEMAQERNEAIFPSLIYSAMAYDPVMVSNSGTETDGNVAGQSSRNPSVVESTNNSPVELPYERQLIVEEDKGVKLGLGDFIFYSVLVGKASSYGDWNTTIACFVAILVGLCLTLLLLATFRMALPALPISIALGLVFYFLTRIIVHPFADSMACDQVFV